MDATTLVAEIQDFVYQHTLDETVARYAAALASWPGEDAGIWLRVSSGKQDEALQLPQELRHCAEHGLRPAKFYVVHARSAFHGKHQADLDQAIEAMRHGEIAALVIWHSDRLERRPGKALLDVLAEFHDAGGRVESVQEPTLGQLDFGGQVTTFIAGLVNHEKSKHISDNTKLGQERISANNGTANRVPWGYLIDGPKYAKKLIPTEYLLKYGPQIFDRCIGGQSCAAIAAWLDTEGVPTKNGKPWNEGSIKHLIQNATYAGRRIRRAKNGEKHGTTFQTCPEAAIIDMDTWTRANKAMANREKRGPDSPRSDMAKPLLAKLRCLHCGSPMYRNRPPRATAYRYRCFGQGAQRKGCGNRVDLAAAETIVAGLLLNSNEPYRVKSWVKGTSWDSEIADTVQSIHELDPIADDYDDQHAALVAQLREYKRLNEEEATPGHWAYTETKATIGDFFDRLDADGRRAYLKTRDIRVEEANHPSAACGMRVVIDGVDYGVFPYPD
jgi:site-specific DNA recombinase